MKKQVYNPFLPLWEYIPDGEPHVFGDRLYLFGSHDLEGGSRYCQKGDYVAWSATVEDLSDWRCEGVIYEAKRDPRVNGELSDLYAPDVVQGNDGRFYLYYSISGGVGSKGDDHNTAIGVAVADEPAGQYAYLGFVRNADGSPFLKYLPADPAVINDEGVIRLYYGWALSMVAAKAHRKKEDEVYQGSSSQNAGMDFAKIPREQRRQYLLEAETMLFHRTKEQLLEDQEDVMGANHVVLMDDMLTVASQPSRIIPSQFMAYGTEFEGHGFYEASSIRKINDTYYFIYSDENSNMLCYATSKYPDKDFTYRGILQSNGDVGLHERSGKDRVNMTANNHGSLIQVKDQWYIFYHRQTHNSTYSRQACAEKVWIAEDGSIGQAECTSCGLNDGPLLTEGIYSAVIACNITNGNMPHATNCIVGADIPYVTHQENERFVTNIKGHTKIVFKYFDFKGKTRIQLLLRGGTTQIRVFDQTVVFQGSLAWTVCDIAFQTDGEKALSLEFISEEAVDFLELRFLQNEKEQGNK